MAGMSEMSGMTGMNHGEMGSMGGMVGMNHGDMDMDMRNPANAPSGMKVYRHQ